MGKSSFAETYNNSGNEHGTLNLSSRTKVHLLPNQLPHQLTALKELLYFGLSFPHQAFPNKQLEHLQYNTNKFQILITGADQYNNIRRKSSIVDEHNVLFKVKKIQ